MLKMSKHLIAAAESKDQLAQARLVIFNNLRQQLSELKNNPQLAKSLFN